MLKFQRHFLSIEQTSSPLQRKNVKITPHTFHKSCKTSASIFPGTFVANSLEISNNITAISGLACAQATWMLGHHFQNTKFFAATKITTDTATEECNQGMRLHDDTALIN
jgi:hypothetical protein